jgi:D-ribulokinase
MMDKPANSARYVIGVDVGTGSARAGVFDLAGRMLGTEKHAITLHRAAGGIVEQDAKEIWQAVTIAVKGAVAASGIDQTQVAGIGFDATCSLVVVGPDGASLPVGDPNEPARNVIVWMDHRAVDQAQRISKGAHDVLRYVGGVISPEMETPKLLWLKENRREVFDAAWQFFDLTDYLTWRASGDLARSSCTVTCKWTYLAHESRWDADYFRAIGLSELADEGFARIGQSVVAAGTALGAGLGAAAAADFGLAVGTPVAAGLIDAHAGGIGTVGAVGKVVENLAYVFGTSSCTMTTTAEPVFVPGVWGPYRSAMVPDMWLNEGGQSAAGAAIDHLLKLHPASARLAEQAANLGTSLAALMAERINCPASESVHLARSLHVVPEFIGNRAPHADPHSRAIISGLGMDEDEDSLLALYIAGLCGLGYGLRQIIEIQAENGAGVKRVVISGGAGQSNLVRQILADATGIPVVATRAEEPVLLGSAILGAMAAGLFDDMPKAMRQMSHVDRSFDPAGGDIAMLHNARYRAFQRLQDLARDIRSDAG